jgi:hypothetical protein
LSFFDDDEETAPRPSPRAPRRAPAGDRAAGASARRPGPRPRRPQRHGGGEIDQQTLMVRRLVAAGVAIVLIIVVVLLVSGCLKSEKQQALKTYNHEVSALAQESEKLSHPLFVALSGASGKSALDVEQQIDELLTQARAIGERAKGLSVPGEMAGAQQGLLLTLDLRTEAMTKLASLVPAALGGKAKQLSAKIAGAMEIFLASDVVYSQRVAPLTQQTLASAGITGLSTAPSRFLPNIGWLEASTAAARLAGEGSSSSQSAQTLSGHHGSALLGVSVGGTTLEAEPAINHIAGGGNPTLTAIVEDAGEFEEPNVKVDVTVTAAGKQYKASGVIPKTEPGKRANAEIALTGLPVGQAAKIEVQVEPVPGETNHEGTKGTFLAIFGE